MTTQIQLELELDLEPTTLYNYSLRFGTCYYNVTPQPNFL